LSTLATIIGVRNGSTTLRRCAARKADEASMVTKHRQSRTTRLSRGSAVRDHELVGANRTVRQDADSQAGCVLADRALEERESSGPVDDVRSRAIFVVDADADARRNIETRLATLRMTNPMVGLADGEEALHALRQSAEGGRSLVPALVVVDLELPGRSGLDVVRAMRETIGLEDVPVVVLSAVDDAASVTEAYHLGVRSYLVKPTGFDALASILRDLHLPWALT